jgi:2,6-dihydroxypyridine 3-monooxygenase
LLPDVSPTYAGYVAWRGTVGKAELGPENFETLQEAIAYYVMPNSHILTYPIPIVDRSPGQRQRFVNWLWYRNVAEGPELDDLMTDKDGVRRAVSLYPGIVRERHVAQLRDDAESTLPPPLSELVVRTAEPFIQVIIDVSVPRMAFGRVCLIGDAAVAARPHAAAGTAKAAENGYKLAEAIRETGGDVPAALRQWEPGQLELGKRVLERTREAGRRSQFEGTWRVGDPLPFGLYEVGDSLMAEA